MSDSKSIRFYYVCTSSSFQMNFFFPIMLLMSTVTQLLNNHRAEMHLTFYDRNMKREDQETQDGKK